MTFSTNRAARVRQGLLVAVAAATLFGAGAGVAYAEPDRGAMQGGEHAGWAKDQGANHAYQRGERMGYNDWNNAPVVDYRAQHLRRPRAGYEWREHNGRYVMVAVATGLIASVILSGGR